MDGLMHSILNIIGGFDEKEIKKWFEDEGFSKIKLVTKYNINIRGELR